MPALQPVEPCCQKYHACHWDGSLAPSFALQSISVMFEVLVGLPLSLLRRPPSQDAFSSIRGQFVDTLAYCVASVWTCHVCLAVSLIVPGNARVPWDPADSGFDAVGAEGPSTRFDCPC